MTISSYPPLVIIVRFTCWASLMGGLFMLLSNLPFIMTDVWQNKNFSDGLLNAGAALLYGATAMGVVGFVVALGLAIFRQRYRRGLLSGLIVLGVLLSLPVSFLLLMGIGPNKSLATAWAIIALNALTAGGALGVAAWRVLPR